MAPTGHKVKKIARQRGITVDRSSGAAYLSREVSRIDGHEGDETLDLIADLMSAEALSDDEGFHLVREHSAEKRSGTSSEDDDRQEVEHGMGSVR